MLTYGSVCSGVEAASLAWETIGFSPQWFSENDAFPSAVLSHRWPRVLNVGDMMQVAELVKAGHVEAPDIFVGGTPCQSFSIAGLRGGLSDDRGQLTLEFIRIANEIDRQRDTPCTVVWENVPGVLTSKDNAFGCFLAGLAGDGLPYELPRGQKWTKSGIVVGPQRAVCWRVLDAQYFGVAQRRKRVFVVASARDGFDPAKVLLEFDGVRRDLAPSRETKQETTGTITTRVGAPDRIGQYDCIVPTLDASYGRLQGCSGQDLNHNHSHLIPFDMQAFGKYGDGRTASTIKARDHKDATDLVVAFAQNSRNELRLEGGDGQIVGTLASGGGKPGQGYPAVAGRYVRRLTPRECERLQGMPDDHTRIPWRGKSAEDCPDGHRYKAIGNSMAVPVMRWIGCQIVKEWFKC